MGSYSKLDKEICLNMFLKDMTLPEISKARDGKPSHQTLYNWAEAGEPHHITGGLSWDDYKQKVTQNQLQESRQRSLMREAEGEKSFIDEAKEKTRHAFDKVYERIIDGSADVRGSDLDKMLRLYLLLDNQAAEKVAWMENFATKVFAIAFDIMDDRQFALFKAKVMDIEYSKRRELEPMVHPSNMSK